MNLTKNELDILSQIIFQNSLGYYWKPNYLNRAATAFLAEKGLVIIDSRGRYKYIHCDIELKPEPRR